MTNHTPFRTDDAQGSSPFGPSAQTPFGSSSAFGAGAAAEGSPFSGIPTGGPLRPRRRGIGAGTIIIATVVPLIAAAGFFFWADRSADQTQDEILGSVQQALDQTVAEVPDVPAAPAAPAAPAVPAAVPADAQAATELAESILEDATAGVGVASGGSLLSDGAALRSVVDQVAAAVGSDDPRVLSGFMYPTYASFSLQDPNIPANVDNYTWRGGLVEDAQPVQLIGDGDLETSLFNASEVNWDAIAALVAEAPEAVSIDGGEVSHVFIERALPFSSDIRIRVFVTGTRDSGYVDGSADGTMISINGN